MSFAFKTVFLRNAAQRTNATTSAMGKASHTRSILPERDRIYAAGNRITSCRLTDIIILIKGLPIT